MTEAQRQLAADNHNIIYWALGTMGLPVDEYYSLAAIGLCKAAIRYRPERGGFANFAKLAIRCELLKELTYKTRQKRTSDAPTASLDYLVGKDENMTVESILADKQNGPEDVLSHIYISQVLNTIENQYGEKARLMVELRASGLTLQKVADRLGVSKQAVAQKIKATRAYIGKAAP